MLATLMMVSVCMSTATPPSEAADDPHRASWSKTSSPFSMTTRDTTDAFPSGAMVGAAIGAIVGGLGGIAGGLALGDPSRPLLPTTPQLVVNPITGAVVGAALGAGIGGAATGGAEPLQIVAAAAGVPAALLTIGFPVAVVTALGASLAGDAIRPSLEANNDGNTNTTIQIYEGTFVAIGVALVLVAGLGAAAGASATPTGRATLMNSSSTPSPESPESSPPPLAPIELDPAATPPALEPIEPSSSAPSPSPSSAPPPLLGTTP